MTTVEVPLATLERIHTEARRSRMLAESLVCHLQNANDPLSGVMLVIQEDARGAEVALERILVAS